MKCLAINSSDCILLFLAIYLIALGLITYIPETLTPPRLADMLNATGVRYRVCYSADRVRRWRATRMSSRCLR